MTDEKVIIAENLTKRFGSFVATDHISFSVRRGEIFGFLGANGAGKTTAMRMLCGLSRPSEGRAVVAGFDVASQAEQVKRHIGYMSQKFSLYDDLTVAENMRLFGGIYGMGCRQIAQRTDGMLADLGLESERNSLVKSLPLGWKQKLAFALAIFHEPAPLLGADISGFRPRNNCVCHHSLYGRGRILRPNVDNGRRKD